MLQHSRDQGVLSCLSLASVLCLCITYRRARGVLVYMQLMILVDGAGGEWPVIGHAPWNGCNLADFAMPFFLFIVGMAIPLSLKVRPSILSYP